MIRVFYVLSAFLFAWLFLHISLTGDTARVSLSELFINSNELKLAGLTTGPFPDSTFLKRTDDTRFSVHTINSKGETVRNLSLPPLNIKKESGETIALTNKPGYLTAALDGSYYLWYPRLGSQIYFFDHEGRFIWEKTESRYLLASERGKFLLAAAGDHSRMNLLNPDMKTLLDFEGLLFIHWQITDNEQSAIQMCLASLDGEFIAGKAIPSSFVRSRIASNIKNAYCDLKTGKFSIIYEKTLQDNNKPGQVFHKDFFKTGMAQLGNASESAKGEITTEKEIMLTFSFPGKTPMVTAQTFSVLLYAESDKLAALLIHDNSTTVKISLENIIPGNFTADQWRGFHYENMVFLHNDSHLLVFDQYGLNHKMSSQGLLAGRTSGNLLMVQTEKQIAGFSLK